MKSPRAAAAAAVGPLRNLQNEQVVMNHFYVIFMTLFYTIFLFVIPAAAAMRDLKVGSTDDRGDLNENTVDI